MEYRNSWMYGSLRSKAGFREEVDKFIQAVEKHAATLTENKDTIICPYKDCKNLMAFPDVTTIKEHLIMRGFVSDYTVWIHHGERMVVDDNDDDQEDDDETLEFLSQYSNELAEQMDHPFGNEQGGDDAGGADNDGEARVGDKDDGDNLEEMLWAIGPEILLKSKKGLENLDRVKSIEGDCVWY
ncbi:uncharacterized protein [Miscanthus floridulus]|uniref:uncharacterized protein n=1 Tax=Miscanthus floridulus TaxID=154761 RepID=UPI00345B1A56